MLTVMIVLAFTAFIATILNAVRPVQVPLWVAVLVLSVIELLRVLPLGK